ncbi:type II toxin-antitoxin system VapC family toxin [Methanobrevibacter sp. OttesenSCG-928-K11]|nr:type II toxin-antitoxin system VapC family toxin [Methanobrevibacter sp. OttesenSCG-928-K11]MDL2271207.1 type II toxin-antitoxin system VapC family toxin [Methanobrevibacter sp. OttesenSCG-928-I08]
MIFVDSSYLIAILINNDYHHKRALKLADKVTEKRIINNTVLTETLNSFTKCGGKLAKELFEMINETHEIQYLTRKDYQNTIDTYLFYGSSINYSDCTMLETMKKLNINKILSFDSDFDKIKGIKRIY